MKRAPSPSWTSTARLADRPRRKTSTHRSTARLGRALPLLLHRRGRGIILAAHHSAASLDIPLASLRAQHFRLRFFLLRRGLHPRSSCPASRGRAPIIFIGSPNVLLLLPIRVRDVALLLQVTGHHVLGPCTSQQRCGRARGRRHRRRALLLQAGFGGRQIRAAVRVLLHDVRDVRGTAVQVHVFTPDVGNQSRCRPHANAPVGAVVGTDVLFPRTLSRDVPEVLVAPHQRRARGEG
mmetsp:Transcript_24573/g.61839  ORF Transcript_24573/g.61839 Transcript_24573/m.61839 type:complete len:237 (-) Transcript_24573:389-1099(-)